MNYDPNYSAPPSRPFDASIPVLTEVLAAPAAEAPSPAAADVDEPLAPLFDAASSMQHGPGQDVAPPAPADIPDAGAQIERFAIDGLNELEWDVLERRLSERILHQLQDRVDSVLEQRIRDSMAEVLQRALADLTDELHKGLQRTLKQVVARAVSEEVAHLQAQKK